MQYIMEIWYKYVAIHDSELLAWSWINSLLYLVDYVTCSCFIPHAYYLMLSHHSRVHTKEWPWRELRRHWICIFWWIQDNGNPSSF